MVYFLTVELNCNLKYQSVIAAFNSNQNFKIEIDWISGICKYSAVLVTCNSTWNSLRCIEIMNQVKTVKIFTCLNYSVTRKLSDILIKFFLPGTSWSVPKYRFYSTTSETSVLAKWCRLSTVLWVCWLLWNLEIPQNLTSPRVVSPRPQQH